MKLKTLFLHLSFVTSTFTYAAPPEDSTLANVQKYLATVDSINATLKYETGKIQLEGGHVAFDVPIGFKYLGADQSRYVVTDLWGNPADNASDILGMIFPENSDPFNDSSYAFIVTFNQVGYVKDDDANDIDYEVLMNNLKEEEKSENIERLKAGYDEVHIIGWAQKPYYDSKLKILHWAKEIKFGNSDGDNTLNYEVRILGRKGILSLNAVSTMPYLPLVKKDISKILNIASFTEGNAYADFDPKVDDVAAWTIGGLVAGKLLAKAGLFAGLLKFLAPLWKFILVGLVAIGAWFRKFIGRRKEGELLPVPVITEPSEEENKDPSE